MLFFAAAVRILDKTQQSEEIILHLVNGDLLHNFNEDIRKVLCSTFPTTGH